MGTTVFYLEICRSWDDSAQGFTMVALKQYYLQYLLQILRADKLFLILVK